MQNTGLLIRRVWLNHAHAGLVRCSLSQVAAVSDRGLISPGAPGPVLCATQARWPGVAHAGCCSACAASACVVSGTCMCKQDGMLAFIQAVLMQWRHPHCVVCVRVMIRCPKGEGGRVAIHVAVRKSL